MDQSSVTDFINENLKTIYAYALSRVTDKNDAEDLTNDIVLAVLQSADKVKKPEAFYGYIWGIAANTYRKFIRKKKRSSFEELDDDVLDEFDFTTALIDREDIFKLRREIALLSKEYRECTIAYYFEDLSCVEVSKKLNISLEMVKYYLFKTRKILKEGICMEREFGEKSFHPAPFEFATIFSGKSNPEYRNLFSRKLPGQILMSAYYTAMTPRELAIELGVSSVYLEDELALLENYGLITKTASGKYQTNLVIFTDDFVSEFQKKSEKFAISELADIISDIKEVLPQIRTLNSRCAKLSDIRLLWGTLWPVMRQGYQNLTTNYPHFQEQDNLYNDATGTNYGISIEHSSTPFGCDAFAGYAGIDENYYASAADFGILPKSNRYFETMNPKTFKEKLYKTVSGEIEPEFMILTKAEETHLFEILLTASKKMTGLYEQFFSCACRLMHTHAPKSIDNQIDRIVFQTLFFQTVGLIGAFAATSGILELPDFSGPVALYVCENKQPMSSVITHKLL